jgi:Lecithin retinol acyltransferase
MIGSTVNVLINQPIEGRISSRDPRLHPEQEPPLGSHLVTPRTFYSHHGIYVGGGRVVHYAGFAHGWRRGPVEEVSLERFAHGHAIRLLVDRPCFDRREVVQRARSRLGECRYDILRNNCEHFCAWALRDETRSRQVKWLRSVPRFIYGWINRLLPAIIRLRESSWIECPARDELWHALNSTECNPATPVDVKRDHQRSALARDRAVGGADPYCGA